MKKTILAFMTLAVIGAGLQTAKAGDREWAVAGKVLTGVMAASVISRALEPAPAYAYSYQPSYSYHAPASPTYSYSYAPAPAPVVVYAAPPPPVVVYHPTYIAPRPVIGFRFNFGGGHHHGHHGGHRGGHHHGHGRW
jgi:hypothetical protein